MWEWIAENKTIAGIAIVLGFLGFNFITGIQLLKWLASTLNDFFRKNENYNEIEENDLNYVAIETKNESKKQYSVKPNMIEESSFWTKFGYIVLKAEEIYGEEDQLAEIIALEMPVIGLLGSIYILSLLLQIPNTIQAGVVYAILGFAGAILGWWLRNRQYFVISTNNGTCYHFNRGLMYRINTLEINLHAEQTDLKKWRPMVLLNGLIIARGDFTDTKEKAFEYFEKDGNQLAELVGVKLKRSSFVWREWRTKLAVIMYRVRRFFRRIRIN